MASELVLIERDGPAALVTLNRPENRNALSIELRLALAEALESLAAAPEVAFRAAVLGDRTG